MPIQLIPNGVAVTGVPTNTTYALPSSKICMVMTNAAVEVSVEGSVWVALTGTPVGPVQTSAQFIRSTVGNNTILVKTF